MIDVFCRYKRYIFWTLREVCTSRSNRPKKATQKTWVAFSNNIISFILSGLTSEGLMIEGFTIERFTIEGVTIGGMTMMIEGFTSDD